jgi:dTDP-glucose pyrophosphorylase
MKIIITMAGFGSRFTKAGFDIPKYEINVLGKPLFEWSMSSLEALKDEHFIFIARNDDRSKIPLINLIKNSKIQKFDIKFIDFATNGQASTALQASDFLEDTDEVIIFNIDTHIIPYTINKNDFSNTFGTIHTFKANGENWSFVKTDKLGNVIEVTEKIKISENASIGLYHFKNWSIFKKYYHKHSNDIIKQYKEIYIAPIYNYILKDFKVKIVQIPKENVFILGTPTEVEFFSKNYKSNNNINID